jgi:hypothetical protein
MPADFDPGRFEHVEVNAKKKKTTTKRSRCRLCGEQWWDIPSLSWSAWASSQDGRSSRSMANVRSSTTRKTPFGGRRAR